LQEERYEAVFMPETGSKLGSCGKSVLSSFLLELRNVELSRDPIAVKGEFAMVGVL